MELSTSTLKFVFAAALVSLGVWYFNFSQFTGSSAVQELNGHMRLSPDNGKLHILVTGGAGYIGSHATLLLTEQGHAVTVVDNLSRGNMGALFQLNKLIPNGKFKFVNVELGDARRVCEVMHAATPKIDLVIHFAAVAYVGESVKDPLQYYKNITVNTVNILDCMQQNQINQLVYSSTCAVYGNPSELPVTEKTPPLPINPYGEAKLMSEQVIRWYSQSNPAFKAIILRYFNVYGSDPAGRLGEYPRPELRPNARISGACMDAALGNIPHLAIKGTQHPTPDGTCIRDYIHVMDLISAHMAGMSHLNNPPPLYNIGTGKGVSVKEFVQACKKVTGKDIQIIEQKEARPGDYAEVWSDVTKINTELGWKANYTNIEEGLQHAWSWRQAHPDGYKVVH